MKLIIFTLLISCYFVFSQDENGSAELSRCFNGTVINGEGVVNEVDCDFPESSCMTKIEFKNDTQNGVVFDKSVRQCTQTEACENNAKGNEPKCYPGENGLQLCFFCCDEDLCNSSTDIPDQPEEEVEEEAGS